MHGVEIVTADRACNPVANFDWNCRCRFLEKKKKENSVLFIQQAVNINFKNKKFSSIVIVKTITKAKQAKIIKKKDFRQRKKKDLKFKF